MSLTVQEKQRIRLQRYRMAVVTYGMAMLALLFISRLGLGTFSTTVWMVMFILGIVGNGFFLVLFLTGTNLRFSDPSLTSQQIVFAAFWGMVPLWALPAARPILLLFFLPALGFGMLRLNFRQYFTVVCWNMLFYALLLGWESQAERPGFQLEYELFLFGLYGILLIWLALFGGFVSKLRTDLYLRNHQIEKMHQGLQREIEVRVQAEEEKDRLIQDLQKAISKIKVMGGLLPICSNCKNIRDDQGYWSQIEIYIRDHSEAEFSHSICPDCVRELYPYLELNPKD